MPGSQDSRELGVAVRDVQVVRPSIPAKPFWRRAFRGLSRQRPGT